MIQLLIFRTELFLTSNSKNSCKSLSSLAKFNSKMGLSAESHTAPNSAQNPHKTRAYCSYLLTNSTNQISTESVPFGQNSTINRRNERLFQRFSAGRRSHAYTRFSCLFDPQNTNFQLTRHPLPQIFQGPEGPARPNASTSTRELNSLFK